MKIPRDISAKYIIKLRESIEYINSQHKGSHVRLTSLTQQDSHHITIPNHNPLKIGTLNNILNDLSNYHQIDKEELITRLLST